MKPVVPPVPLPIWQNLYAAAHEFHAMRPWEMLDASDLIGVRDTLTGETGFGACMGSGGTLFGFCLYRGADGFELYRRLMEGAIDIERDDFYAMQNCLKLELGPRSELEPNDLAVIRQLGVTFKGKDAWPEFRSLMPGYAPWFLTEAEAQFLTLGLNAACCHSERVDRGEVDKSFRDGECLVYTPVNAPRTKYDVRWEPWPVGAAKTIAPPVLNLPRINALRTKNLKTDTPWEADVFYLPSQVLDRERPYFVRLRVVCHQSSGYAFGGEPSMPEAPIPQLLADAICSAIEKCNLIPETIFVKGADEAAALVPLGKALGFTIQRRDILETAGFLKESLMEQLVQEGGGRRRKK